MLAPLILAGKEPLLTEFFDVTAIATTVTAFGTLAIFVVTALMVQATKRMAKVSELTLKAGTTPQVIAYLQDHFHDSIVPLVTVTLENIGHGSAQNVIYRLDIEDEGGQEIARRYFIANRKNMKMDFMPAGAKREITLDSTANLYDPDKESSLMAPFTVTVQYENLNGEKFETKTFTLDLDDFEGRGGVAKSSVVDIEKSLRSLPEIKRLMERLVR